MDEEEFAQRCLALGIRLREINDDEDNVMVWMSVLTLVVADMCTKQDDPERLLHGAVDMIVHKFQVLREKDE